MGLRGPGDKEGRLPALPLRSPPRRPARCPARRDLGSQDLGPGIQGDRGPRGRRRPRHRSRPTVWRVQGQRSGRARGEQSSSQAKSTAEERQLTAGPRPVSGILRTGLPSSVTLSRQNHRPRKMSKGRSHGAPSYLLAEPAMGRPVRICDESRRGEGREAAGHCARPWRARDMTGHTEAEKKHNRMDELAAIVEYSDDAIIGKTLDGVIKSWNPAAERMYGYSSEEIMGQSIELLSPKDRTGEIKTVLARIKAGEHVHHFETIRIRKDGKLFPVSLSFSPICDTDGQVVGASTIARDVTNQAHAFDAARGMIESSLDSLVAISPEGRITDANEATVKVTGVPREELIGTAFSDCFTEPEKANKIYQLVFAQGMAVDYPLTMRHKDGTLTEVLYNASVYRDASGNVLGVFAAARDVTKQMQAQRETADEQAKALGRLAELERFQRLTVGRELKMIELKKEIEALLANAPEGRDGPGYRR